MQTLFHPNIAAYNPFPFPLITTQKPQLVAFWHPLLLYTLHHRQHFMDSCTVPVAPLKHLPSRWISQPNQIKDDDIHI